MVYGPLDHSVIELFLVVSSLWNSCFLSWFSSTGVYSEYTINVYNMDFCSYSGVRYSDGYCIVKIVCFFFSKSISTSPKTLGLKCNWIIKTIKWRLLHYYLTGMALCKVALSDGSDLVVGEEMKIGLEFYIHYRRDHIKKILRKGFCLRLNLRQVTRRSHITCHKSYLYCCMLLYSK